MNELEKILKRLLPLVKTNRNKKLDFENSTWISGVLIDLKELEIFLNLK